MTTKRISLTLNLLLLLSLILTSCSGAPTLPSFNSPTATSIPSTSAVIQLPWIPALIETDPPLNTVIGHTSPITFYFNQGMNKPSVESAFSGLPQGSFTWTDDATLVFTPAQPYQPNATLNITLGNSIQSATGFGISQPIEINFTVADYLRAINILPKASAIDVNVDSAIVASFNQPVVPLGAEADSMPAAFTLVPSASGKGEWVNTSTYVFYPNPALAGGTEYAVSLDPALRSVTGVGYEGSEGNAWKFVTALPQVVSLSPASDSLIPLDPEITLTFNQPMDTKSVEAHFSLTGPEGTVNGKFKWNANGAGLTFTPNGLLARNVGYLLNINGSAKSKGGKTLGSDYGAVLRTFDAFAVTSANINFNSISFILSAPIQQGEYENLIVTTPAVDFSTWVSEDGLTLTVLGNFTPDTEYTLEVSADLKDKWGQALGAPFVLNVRTPPLRPNISPKNYSAITAFVRPDEPVLYASAANIQNAEVIVAPLSLPDFFSLQNSYENQQAYVPANGVSVPQTFSAPASAWQDVKLSLTQDNNQLPTGLYYVNPSSPQLTSKLVYFAASSQVNLTFKVGATEALVWAVDLPSQTPVANASVVIYDHKGVPLAYGVTDASGIWKGALGDREPYSQVYAILGAPGDDTFAMAVNVWNAGTSAYDFGYAKNVQKPHTELYMYSDRPIYRPGQTVFFRGAVREAFNGRYELPSITSIPVTLTDSNGAQIANLNLQLSPFGTFNGQIELPANAAPGYYTFTNQVLNFYFSFQVAEYRKPEIDLGVKFSKIEIKRGDKAQAIVNANYFFGAPAGNANVKWAIYVKPDSFNLPNYQTGVFDDSWLDAFYVPGFQTSAYFGTLLAEGTGQTTPKGILSIDLPAIPESDTGQIVTIEVTIADESGLPVSARSEIKVHPDDFYIGIHPDQWFGSAKSALGFDVFTADWAGAASGEHPLVAEFKQVRWDKETDQYGYPTYTPVYTPVSSSNLATGPDGRARLSFTPLNAGTYVLDLSGGNAHTQILIWVGGSDSAAWADLPSQRVHLTLDKELYKPGDTARIFIPNPFATNALALVTVERGIVSKAEVIIVSGSGTEYQLPLGEDDAPNVYVTVTMLGQGNDFRQGIINLPVAADAQKLNVQVTANPPEAGPRDTVTFDVYVTDQLGQPVQGEFSFSIVDKAVLALADPNAQDIFPAYYSNQPLGIETGVSLSVYTGRNMLQPGGLGGGGGGDQLFLREDFPDTAYWNPALITNADGRGQVTITLPDSLTTWHIDVRGLTVDTKVGQAQTEIIATKPLLIRPVTPRFLVNGDHVLLAAIVNNNTTSAVQATINLQSDGFILDDPGNATLNVKVPANGRYRAEWWGTAAQAESADLVFSVTTSGTPSLQDAARPVWGKLPILQYSAPQTFVTGGALTGAVSQQEVISLPRSFIAVGGGLDVELSPSLAGSLLSALAAMPDLPESQSAEAIASDLLPNLEVQRALNGAGMNDKGLSERIAANINASVNKLMSLQNEDGGWGWWGNTSPLYAGTEGGGKSDPYISAYVFFVLQRARFSGATVNDNTMNLAVTYLQNAYPTVEANQPGETLDTIAFIQFTLSEIGLADATVAGRLYEERNRMGPAGRAWTALVFNKINPADSRVRDLTSNLGTSAILTASGAHWETQRENFFTRGSAIYTTSIVVYALAQLDPGNAVLSNAVRYLAAHRNAGGLWNQGHDNAWAIVALNQAMVGMGELRADFTFNAALNGSPLTSGDVAGIQITPLTTFTPLTSLSANTPNLLTINRAEGLGRLYYNIVLRINRLVRDVKPLDRGMNVERVYCRLDKTTKHCTPLTSVSLASNQPISAKLTLILPHNSYYVMLEDFIPAGMEILNQDLKTSQLGIDSGEAQILFDENDPFANGWGWWLFNEPQIRDDSILFSANFLPAGTYTLTYTLIPLQAGTYQVLPAHAWESFFPEVQGTSAGAVFEIKP